MCKTKVCEKSCGRHLVHQVICIATKSTKISITSRWACCLSKYPPTNRLFTRILCQHLFDVGESHTWICDCKCDASGRMDNAQTELTLEMMWCHHGCDSGKQEVYVTSCETTAHCNRDHWHFIKMVWKNNPNRLCVLVTCLRFGLCPFDFLDHCRILCKCRFGLSGTVWNVEWNMVNGFIYATVRNVNETEWLFRVCAARGFPWLPHWTMFPTHIRRFDELVNHPFVNLREALRCCEKSAVCFLHTPKMGTNLCDPNTHNEPTSWRGVWISQVTCKWSTLEQTKGCNLRSDWQNCWNFWSC